VRPSIDAPPCPHCGMPMRLLCVLPRVGENSPVETQTFRCSKCSVIKPRTVFVVSDEAPANEKTGRRPLGIVLSEHTADDAATIFI
jgi:hypothetical protein